MSKFFPKMNVFEPIKFKPLLFCLSVCLLSLIFLLSCSRSSPDITPNLPAETFSTKTSTLGPGDEIEIKFTFWPEMNDTQSIRPDGMISLPYIDEVQASGRTPEQLDQFLTKRYEKTLKDPDITISVKSFATQNVYVGGEVGKPGLLKLEKGLTPLQAIMYSGGFSETAKPEETIIIRKGTDDHPEPIRVNLQAIMNDKAKAAAFQLQPADILYVPESGIAAANQFVNDYIERLLLLQGINLGVSYNLDDDDSNRDDNHTDSCQKP